MYRPISDYALIGDCESAALVSSEGSIDWLCFPHFDSPALFLRLLDDNRGGSCSIEVEGRREVSRAYEPGTNILETTIKTGMGTLVSTDFMPLQQLAPPSREGQDAQCEHRIIRLLSCTAGEVEVRIEAVPTFRYAQEPATFTVHGRSSVTARGHSDALHVDSEGQELRADDTGKITASVRLTAGQQCALVLAWSQAREQRAPETLKGALQALGRTRDYWKRWSGQLAYEGQYRDAIMRSALALKLMTYEPTGAIVAAPTTSLPEVIDGERNWDYRFTWTRDATFTLIALMNLGYFGEARDFLHFLRCMSQPDHKFQVLYTIEGGRDAREKNLDKLEGYRHSRPVRIGNAAVGQQQLDIFGELIHCVYLYVAHPESPTPRSTFQADFWPLVQAAADFVAQHWSEPDSGIWEMRGKPQQFVYSKGSCWLALDRALRLARHFGLKGGTACWQKQRDALHDSFFRQGFNPQANAFVQSYGSTQLDAAALRLPIMGIVGAKDPRMASTIARIEKQLMSNGLVYRYRTHDGLEGDEGAFAACGFWLVHDYALAGRLLEADELFRHQLSFANDVGLLSEQIDARNGAQLGNFPQAFTHIALVNAGIRLEGARHGHRTSAHAIAEEEVMLPEKVA